MSAPPNQRYTGTVERLCAIDVAAMAAWVAAIPLADWHQQKPLGDGQLRPAMMTDLAWHGFGAMARPVIEVVLEPGLDAYQVMLSCVMPGHGIEQHRDAMAGDWLYRVHVPLLTNDWSYFRISGERHHMYVGAAFKVNTEALHSVTNDGDTPRIHLMFDVRHR